MGWDEEHRDDAWNIQIDVPVHLEPWTAKFLDEPRPRKWWFWACRHKPVEVCELVEPKSGHLAFRVYRCERCGQLSFDEWGGGFLKALKKGGQTNGNG
jgi:hypothetical protein